jgi:glycosyltransferase involved in cell wall biosynthesis
VEVISWRNQYPFFYPGVQFVPADKPELEPFANTRRVLSWKNPIGWWQCARRLKHYDEVIFVWWVPSIQGPVYLNMLRTLGKNGPTTVLICHNVLQHAVGPVDERLARSVLNRVDTVVVHSEAQASLAQSLSHTPVVTLKMAAHLPGNPSRSKPHSKLYRHLLFFGLVRHYKGVDRLLEAMADVSDITLTVAGEMWGKNKDELMELAHKLKLEKRVTLRPGYVPAEAIAHLFADADALVLPYRSGTATQNADLAFAHGVPVIATRVGSIPDRLHDGVDCLLCEPDDATALAAAIHRFYEPGVARELSRHLPATTADHDWQMYIQALTQSDH